MTDTNDNFQTLWIDLDERLRCPRFTLIPHVSLRVDCKEHLVCMSQNLCLLLCVSVLTPDWKFDCENSCSARQHLKVFSDYQMDLCHTCIFASIFFLTCGRLMLAINCLKMYFKWESIEICFNSDSFFLCEICVL